MLIVFKSKNLAIIFRVYIEGENDHIIFYPFYPLPFDTQYGAPLAINSL